MTPLPETVEPAPRGLRGRTVAILVAIAFVAGLAATAWLMSRWSGWQSWLGTPQTLAGTSADGNASAAADPGRAALDAQVMSVPDDSISLAETAARESLLSGRIAALESRLATIDLRATAASGNAARAEGLLVAFAARRAIDRGLGLGYVEAELRERFGESEPRAVGIVIQAARNPVTLQVLQVGLDELAPDLATTEPSRDWWDGVKAELGSLIVVRRAGTPSPRPSDRLDRARQMLEGGQVDVALAEIARLPGAPRAAEWMKSARRYVLAHRALDRLETAAILEPRRSAHAATSLAPPPPAPETATSPATPTPALN